MVFAKLFLKVVNIIKCYQYYYPAKEIYPKMVRIWRTNYDETYFFSVMLINKILELLEPCE